MDFMTKEPETAEERLLKEAVGLRLRALREASGLGQEALGESVGSSQSAIQKWEVGDRWPKPHVLLAIFVRIGGDFNFLYQGKYDHLPGDLVARMARTRPEIFLAGHHKGPGKGKHKA